MGNPRRISPFTTLVFITCLMVSLGCNLPFTIALNTPTETPAPMPTSLTTCVMPNLVGMNAAAAEALLAKTGIKPVLTPFYSYSSSAPDLVLSQKPAAGSILDLCGGLVTLEVSLGPGATPTGGASPTLETSRTSGVTPTRPAATLPALTPTRPAASATLEGAKLKDADFYDQLYLNNFPARDGYGLLSERWKQVVVRPGSTVGSLAGLLKINGKVEFYGGGAFQHHVRVSIGGAKFGVGLAQFDVFVDYQDDKNNLRLGCSDTAAAGLSCSWFQKVGGAETILVKNPVPLCSGACDLQIELDNGDIRVYANNLQRLSLKNAAFPTGQIGLSIDAPAAANFSLDRIVVYEIPKTTIAKVLFREDFGGDISLDPNDSDFLTTTITPGDGFIKFKAQAKQGVFYYQAPYNRVLLPAAFQLSQSARFLSGAKTAALGLNFQIIDKDNYYAALLNTQGAIQILAKVKGQWQTLLAPTPAAGFREGEANTLTIKGEGSKYTVQLNGKNAASFNDERLSAGFFGLAVQLDNPNDQLQVEIYQMEVRR
jgi:hypothetical protein